MRRIWNTVLKGLVAVLPLGLTIYFVYWLAFTAERIFSRLLRLVLPDEWYWPGLGLIVGLSLLYAVGLAVNAYVVRRALRLSDAVFARIPVVKTVYLAIRDFLRFFPSSGHSHDLRRVVLVPFGPGKVIGFVTAESGSVLGVPGHDEAVGVYLPMSYMIGGYTVFVPRTWVQKTDMRVEVAMRSALTAWIKNPSKV